MREALKWVVVAACSGSLLLSGCVAQATPAPAELRTSPPPWDAPRDAVSYIDAAGLPQLPLDVRTNSHLLEVFVWVDGRRVPLAPSIGIDRLRAVQAPVHTHDDSGQVWLEGERSEEVTLGDFFTLWGVRFSAECLGAACGSVRVTVDGRRTSRPADVRLVEVREYVDVRATS